MRFTRIIVIASYVDDDGKTHNGVEFLNWTAREGELVVGYEQNHPVEFASDAHGDTVAVKRTQKRSFSLSVSQKLKADQPWRHLKEST